MIIFYEVIRRVNEKSKLFNTATSNTYLELIEVKKYSDIKMMILMMNYDDFLVIMKKKSFVLYF